MITPRSQACNLHTISNSSTQNETGPRAPIKNLPSHNTTLPPPPGNTPLIQAAQGGRAAVARFLLQRGADPSAANADGNTPLSWAAFNGNDAIVRDLLRAGASVDVTNANGGAPRMPLGVN